MVAQSIPADALLEAIRSAGVQDVVLVPDTHQRTLVEALMAAEDIRTCTAPPRTRPSRSAPA